MIDTWFNNDIAQIHNTHPVSVFIDERGDAEFLLKILDDKLEVYTANTELEELHAKYIIEKQIHNTEGKNKNFVIYTTVARDNLTFLREYCEVYGCVEIKYLENYIKDKVHKELKLNINLPKDEIIAAAQVSIGKNQTYWMDISHKGATEIFDLEKELLPFIHDPEGYINRKYDKTIQETFYRKVNELLNQAYIEKPPSTLASEVVTAMFNGLIANNCHPTLLAVYKKWLDSLSYSSSFLTYVSSYSVPSNINIWEVNTDHPFESIDKQWLKELGSQIAHGKLVEILYSQRIISLKKRRDSKQVKARGISFWEDIIKLLEFEPAEINRLTSMDKCIEFYKSQFSAIDTAIRNLYTKFLNEPKIIEPFQSLYKGHIDLFLDKWFAHFDSYEEDQTGVLQRIIDNNNQKIAIIVGDGVAYEVANQVADKVDETSKIALEKDHILVDWPSITLNNMSHIYIDNGTVEPVKNKREKYFSSKNPDLMIDYINLEQVSDDALSGQVLICTYKDIDDMGDKLNNKALKYFQESIEFFAQKIHQLLDIGYSKVYLITDHGFVLTGMLSEADKIIDKPQGLTNTSERYIWTTERQGEYFRSRFIEKAKESVDGVYNYLYFAKNMNPFKTPSTYGFAHGGLAPQELITPYFCWFRDNLSDIGLKIEIDNKQDLSSVTGELYKIRVRAESSELNLFTQERKVALFFFANSKHINTSDMLTLEADETIDKEYAFDGYSEVHIQLIDAVSKELLDTVIVRKNNERDLGGLL